MNIVCIICSDILIPSADIYSTNCGHLFHYACLLQWIERSKTCPQCRHKNNPGTIHRIYFNLNNTESTDDVGTLLNKLEQLQYQMSLKDMDIKNFKEKYKKAKTQSVELRKQVMELESTEKANKSIILAMKDQISFFKSKARDNTKMSDEVARLQAQLKKMDAVQVAINGSREEVNDMLRNETNVESMAILTAILKKTLIETESKKAGIDYKAKQLQNEVNKYKRDVAALDTANNDLKKELESHKSTWMKEKEYLTSMLQDSGKSPSSKLSENLKRILTESPMPRKYLKKEDFDLNVTTTPTLGEKVTEILDSDSPYLPIKSNNMGSLALQNMKLKQLQSNKMSIFKGPIKTLDNMKKTERREDIGYDGLGGQCKEDVYPTPKSSAAGLKRHRSNVSISSNKFRKLAPVMSLTKKIN